MNIPCLGPHLDLNRRAFLTGGLGALLSLAIPRWQALAADPKRPAKACILLWMNGGPSHLDTFDPKPGTKVGGPFKTVKTRIKDVQICEHLPRVADQADKLAIIRSMTTKEGNHDRAQYLMHTGYSPSVTLQHPGFGAWVSHELSDPKSQLPSFVSVRGPSVGAGFLGVEHNPLVVQDPREGIRNLAHAKDVDAGRFDRRLAAFQILQKNFQAETGIAEVAGHGKVYDKAVRMMRSPLAKTFDISQEPEAARRAYGDSDFGRGCLLARRLVEAGVKFVEVTLDGWDTHVNNFLGVKNLLADLDPALATLLKDLADRKLLDETLVICMGEFGRTPEINPNEGRDHFPHAWSTVLAGGGVRAGQAYGSTNAAGAEVASQPVTVKNFFATVATLLSMDPGKEVMSPVGRPIAISDAGRPVEGLIAS